MAAMTVHANKRAFPRPLRAVTTRSFARFYRYQVASGAWTPLSGSPQQQPNHPLDVDQQPGQQILDAVPGPPTIARPSSIVLADNLGQFAFDRRMLTAYLLVSGRGCFLACQRILRCIVVDNDHPPDTFGQLLQAVRLQGTPGAAIPWEDVLP